MGYNFTAEWLKGASNSAPNALSRHPVTNPVPQDLLGESEFDNTPATSPAEVRAITATDPETLRIQNLKQIAGGPETQALRHQWLPHPPPTATR